MVRIHKEGYKFLFVLFILGFSVNLVILMLNIPQWIKITIIFLIVIGFLFFLQFFRSPAINKNLGKNKIISPANGKVVHIGEVYEDEYFNEKKIMISIFMSPLDVHINRNPIRGIIKYYKYHKGKYLVAWHPKSSELNERTTVVLENDTVGQILYRQIAGAVARRIVNYAKVGDKVVQGRDAGFIKFGSRVDIFLPLGTKINVKIDQKVRGGEDCIAEF